MAQYFAWQNYVTVNTHFYALDSEITLFPAVKQIECG